MKFKDASVFYTTDEQINTNDLERWLKKSSEIQWDYKNIVKRKGLLERLTHLITGVICGYRVEEIDNPLTQQVRYLDKLVDELAKGRKMEKILRGA